MSLQRDSCYGMVVSFASVQAWVRMRLRQPDTWQLCTDGSVLAIKVILVLLFSCPVSSGLLKKKGGFHVIPYRSISILAGRP